MTRAKAPMSVEQVKAQPNLLARYRAATRAVAQLQLELEAMAEIRAECVRQLLAEGWTQRDLAEELGVTHGRIGQIAAGL